MESILLTAPFSTNDIRENPELLREFSHSVRGTPLGASSKVNAYLESLATPFGVKVSVNAGLMQLNREGGYNHDELLPVLVTYPNRKALVEYLTAVETATNSATSVNVEDIEDMLAEMGV